MPSDGGNSNLAREISTLRIPRHLAVTMDGNGRWAVARGKPRTEGHRAGIDALRRLVDLSIRYDVAFLTVFSFSSENWSRPREEIRFIFNLLQMFVTSDLEKLVRNNVRVRVIGEKTGLDANILSIIEKAERETGGNTGLTLVVAFNYGGKTELVRAAQTLAQRVLAGEISPEQIDEAAIGSALYAADVPEPDIVLRTSGEHRISNFLLWQSAYSELIFIEENWPDFNEASFLKVLEEFGRRERRFGGVEATDK